jgi:hypothetical protein
MLGQRELVVQVHFDDVNQPQENSKLGVRFQLLHGLSGQEDSLP